MIRLEALCGDDQILRQEVDSLLRADARGHRIVNAAETVGGLERVVEAMDFPRAIDHQLPNQIGGYRVLGEIGRGGMGIIYEAQQVSPHRRVALKILRPGLIDREILRRFHQEAHVLGQLQHAGIAQIFEAGIADTALGDQPFLVMELVEGDPLDVAAESHDLTTNQRLELLARVCDAVQHAHQKGVIHRDLKPSNVLVMRSDADLNSGRTPTGTAANHDVVGQPKVLDFGIARMTDSDMQTVTVQTEVGQLVGTLAYMSPEQVTGKSTDLDTRCDVYALGVMLYELLLRKRPHELSQLSITEAARIIIENEPPRLGSIDRRFRGDIETIVAKAIEKDRERRYGSAAELAADIRRCLNNEPIDARPASRIYQISKFARRNRGLVGALIAALVALSVGLALAVRSARIERKATLQAEADARRLKETLADVQLVSDFQGGVISNVDLEHMGRLILDGVVAEWEVKHPGHVLPAPLDDINASTLARAVVDGSMLSRASVAASEQFASRPLIEATIRDSLGASYYRIALYEQSLREAQRALALRRAELGDDHLDTIKSIGIVGRVLYSLQRLDEAELYYDEALRRLRARFPENDYRVLEARDRMITLMIFRGQFEAALPLAESLLKEAEGALPENDEKLKSYRQHLIMLYSRVGRLEESLTLSRVLLKQSRAQLGDDDIATLRCMTNVAVALGRLNRPAEAEPLFVEILERGQRIMGEQDPRMLRTLHSIGTMRAHLGQVDLAIEAFEELLRRQRRYLPPEHPEVRETLEALAGVRAMKEKRKNAPAD